MTSARVSAGILLFRRAGGRLEVLLAHPGGPFAAGKDAGNWSIPKGEPDPDEDLEIAARREFAEETGLTIDAAAEMRPLDTIRQKGGKLVYAWAVEGDLDPEQSTCNTFELEWPPRSGRIQEFPEVDRVAWFEPDEARRRMKETQRPFVDRLEALLGETSEARATAET